VRLLLDAHVSARRIGAAMRQHGHDVLALDAVFRARPDPDYWRDHLAFVSRTAD
jgi:hypothetical protein